MANKFYIEFHLGKKAWERILEDTLDDYDIQYKRGPFLLKEERLRLKNHRYRTDTGYIDDMNDVIVINSRLPKSERKITLSHELIHGRFPELEEGDVENLAIKLFREKRIGYDFYKKRKRSIKK